MTPEEQIDAIIARCFEVAGPELVDVVRYEINVAYPPASEPGTPPHLRTGNLQALITSRVDGFHDGVALTIISDAFYSGFLQNGTSRMARRDFFGPEAIERYTPIVVQSCQRTIDASPPQAFDFTDSRIAGTSPV